MENKPIVKTQYEDQEIKPIEVKKLDDLFGMFGVSDTAPTGTPRKISEQVVIYKNGGTKRLYWYDPTNGVWSYVTATA